MVVHANCTLSNQSWSFFPNESNQFFSWLIMSELFFEYDQKKGTYIIENMVISGDGFMIFE
jgi:hypothetical protein